MPNQNLLQTGTFVPLKSKLNAVVQSKCFQQANPDQFNGFAIWNRLFLRKRWPGFGIGPFYFNTPVYFPNDFGANGLPTVSARKEFRRHYSTLAVTGQGVDSLTGDPFTFNVSGSFKAFNVGVMSGNGQDGIDFGFDFSPSGLLAEVRSDNDPRANFSWTRYHIDHSTFPDFATADLSGDVPFADQLVHAEEQIQNMDWLDPDRPTTTPYDWINNGLSSVRQFFLDESTDGLDRTPAFDGHVLPDPHFLAGYGSEVFSPQVGPLPYVPDLFSYWLHETGDIQGVLGSDGGIPFDIDPISVVRTRFSVTRMDPSSSGPRVPIGPLHTPYFLVSGRICNFNGTAEITDCTLLRSGVISDPNQIIEVPFPGREGIDDSDFVETQDSGGNATLSNGVINFMVINETPARWSARVGVPL